MASNCYKNKGWYREFLGTERRPFQQRHSDVQREILHNGLEAYATLFHHMPIALIPPGHRISQDTPAIARKIGFKLLSGRHAIILNKQGCFTSRLIPAVPISSYKEMKPTFLEEGFPFCILLHDKDIVENQEGWFEEKLKSWETKVGRRFTTLSELALRLNLKPEVFLDLSSSNMTINFELDTWHLETLNKITGGHYSFWIGIPTGYEVLEVDPQLKVIEYDRKGTILLSCQLTGISSKTLKEKSFFIRLKHH